MAAAPRMDEKEIEHFLQVIPPARRVPALSPLIPRSPLPPVPAQQPAERVVFKRLHDNSSSFLGLQGASTSDGRSSSAEGSASDTGAPAPSRTQSPACCEQHWSLHQQEHRQQVPATLPFRDTMTPPRPASTALNNLRRKDNLTKVVTEEMHANERRQAPLSTICVRWHKLRNDPGYSADALLHCLRPLGDIESVVITSECAARVTFGRLDDACAAANSKNLGRRQNPLQCRWYHKSMENKSFLKKRDHLHVIYNPFLK